MVHTCSYNQREKGRALTQSYDKRPYTHRKIQKESRQHKKMQPKTSITYNMYRFRNDLGRSVAVTAVTPTDVVKPIYERSTFLITTTAVLSKGHIFKNLQIILLTERQNRSTEGCSKRKRSVDMTSSGKNGLNIRTNASPKWDRTRCPEE